MVENLRTPSDGGNDGTISFDELPRKNEANVPGPWVPFPVEALPIAAADYVRAAAAALQVDPAAIAVPVLVVLASAIGNAAHIALKRSWTQPATLWVCLVMHSGSRKSAAIEKAAAPVFTLEKRLQNHYSGERELYDRELRDWKSRDKKLRGPEPDKPVPERFRIDDVTIESVASIHADNPRGLLLYRDELSAWIGAFDKYSKGRSDRPGWMSFYEGRSMSVDRKSGEPRTLYISKPCVSVAGTIQPYVLEMTFGPEDMASGFAARILFIEPPVTLAEWNDADIMPDESKAYQRLFDSLREIPMSDDPAVVVVSPDAERMWRTFYNEQSEILNGMADGPLRAALSRVVATCARVALVLHLSECSSRDPFPPIPAETLGRAIRIAVWLREEQRRVYLAHGFDEIGASVDPWRMRLDAILDRLPQEFSTSHAYDTAQRLRAWYTQSNKDARNRQIRRDLERATEGGIVKRLDRTRFSKIDAAPSQLNVHVQSVHDVQNGRLPGRDPVTMDTVDMDTVGGVWPRVGDVLTLTNGKTGRLVEFRDNDLIGVLVDGRTEYYDTNEIGRQTGDRSKPPF